MSSARSIRVSYATTVFGREETKAVMDVLRNPARIVAGPAVAAFEKKVAALFGKKYGVMVNSGSSANLVALSVLGLPKGAEVITPALTFSTTLAPILQCDLRPVFVDVVEGTYVVDVDAVERAITKKTRALMIPSLIGNLPALDRLQALSKKHHLALIEDSCDTLGPRFRGKPTGAYTDISTTSFYASHIVTAAGGGGMMCFHDAALAERARVMAYWGRQSTLFGAYEKSEELRKRFTGTLAGEPYDAKFIFSEIGYNMQPMELQGAFGLVQLGRLKKFAAIRRKNFASLVSFFKGHKNRFILPSVLPDAEVVWLAFPLTVRPDAGFTRMELTKYLEEHDIQTRPIFTGNVLRQPGFRDALHGLKDHFPVTDAVMRGGFLIGCHHGLTAAHLQYLRKVFTSFLAAH